MKCETVNEFKEAINTEINNYRKSSVKIFDLLKSASDTLSFTDYKILKKEIELDPSTIRKMEKVISNPTLTKNAEVLPVSWGTLYEISRLDEDNITNFVADNKLNRKSTAKEVQELIKETGDLEHIENEEENYVEQTQQNFFFTMNVKENEDLDNKEVKQEIENAIKLLEKYFVVETNLLDFLEETEEIEEEVA